MYIGFDTDIICTSDMFRRQSMHEHGHILGLADCYNDDNVNIQSIMNDFYGNSVSKPLERDLAAVLHTYYTGKKALWSTYDSEFRQYYNF